MTIDPDPDPDPDPDDDLPGFRALLRENEALRAENLALRELCLEDAAALRRAARARAELDEILGSRAWRLVAAARRLSGFLRRRGTPAPAARWEPPRGPARPRPDPPGGPRVSVIVPNYNHAAYLEERLRSIFDQTYRPHEILFLDDASTDESLAVARRLAPRSPAPFRMIVNASNGGGAFRQWLKGIDLADGDLIWIAESDDTCRPDLLERLVPAFLDPDVALAYGQSAMIGPDGRLYAPDYASLTDDIAPARWRHPYCVPGREEVELALGQRNTIPNASAVVFRKPAVIGEREDLESLRLAGDWLFYAMRIRRGKIAYVPETLNAHRHHDRTVRSRFERAGGLFEEQLRVKGRIFEAFPVSAGAISGSMAWTFADHFDRAGEPDRAAPMSENPRLRPHLDRIRAIAWARHPARSGRRILVVASGLSDHPEAHAAIRLANELADRCGVFLCNARPRRLDPRIALRVGPRIVPIEGTLGLRPWSRDEGPGAADAPDDRRVAVVRELIAFHRIDAIHASGEAARRLVAAAGGVPAILRDRAAG